jgi:N-acetylmuramic acid 6-phosphate etherase
VLERLLTEQRNAASTNLDTLPVEQALRIIHEEDRKVADSIAPELPQIARAVDRIADRLRKGGRLFYIGAGTSGRLGVLDASECPPTFNVPETMVQGIIAGGERALTHAVEGAEDDRGAGGRDLVARGFAAGDTLVGIAASGRTPYVLGAVEAARAMGALTVGISCSPESELAHAVEIPITPLPGAEILTGSTRLKAGTATKLVLNMLSTMVMVRLGHVYGNLMVNVQATNYKLRERARRIVEGAAGVNTDEAARLLVEAGGRVKTAIVMAKRGVGQEEAERLLVSAAGRVSEALKADPDTIQAMNAASIGERRSEILTIAARHGAGNVRLFGSVARGQDQADSDVDFLVDVVGETTAWFPGSLIADLEQLLGRRVQVVIGRSLSPLIRDEVLSQAIPL